MKSQTTTASSRLLVSANIFPCFNCNLKSSFQDKGDTINIWGCIWYGILSRGAYSHDWHVQLTDTGLKLRLAIHINTKRTVDGA